VSPASGAAGSSDTEGKAAKGSGERGWSRASFKSVVAAALPISVNSRAFVVRKQKRPSGFSVEAAVPAAILPHATRPFDSAQGRLCHHSQALVSIRVHSWLVQTKTPSPIFRASVYCVFTQARSSIAPKHGTGLMASFDLSYKGNVREKRLSGEGGSYSSLVARQNPPHGPWQNKVE
jgi:hypothetical protein